MAQFVQAERQRRQRQRQQVVDQAIGQQRAEQGSSRQLVFQQHHHQRLEYA